METVSVPKLLILYAIGGLILGLITGLTPDCFTWNETVYKLTYLDSITIFIFIVTVIPLITHLYRTGKFEWLRKPKDEST